MDCNTTAPFSADTFAIIDVSIYSAATGSFGLFGVISNTVVLAVFHRQGILTRSSTVYMTGLAVSDLLNCVFTVIAAVAIVLANYFSPDYRDSTAFNVSFSFGARPMDVTVQVTCWITAMLASERVVSVVFPFRVKSVFTPMRSMAVVVAIFVGSFMLCIPMNFETTLSWVKHPVHNYTYLGKLRTKFITNNLIDVYQMLVPVALRFTAIAIVAFCNVILFWKVHLSAKFRKGAAAGTEKSRQLPDTKSSTSTFSTNTTTITTASSSCTYHESRRNSGDVPPATTNLQTTTTTTKDVRLLRMISIVSVEFTLCYSVFVLYVILYWIVWDWDSCNVHDFEFDLAYNVSCLFQIINSSTNALIYYGMSTRFREDFHTLWQVPRVCRCWG